MRELPGVGTVAANRATAEGMLAIAAMLLLGESSALAHPADADSVDRMITCLQARPTGLILPGSGCRPDGRVWWPGPPAPAHFALLPMAPVAEFRRTQHDIRCPCT